MYMFVLTLLVQTFTQNVIYLEKDKLGLQNIFLKQIDDNCKMLKVENCTKCKNKISMFDAFRTDLSMLRIGEFILYSPPCSIIPKVTICALLNAIIRPQCVHYSG